MQIYFYLLGYGNKFTDFVVFPNFFFFYPTHSVNYKGKKNTEKIQNSL